MLKRFTEEELIANEAERKANLVGHEEFRILTSRVDTMDTSIGTIVGRVSFRLIISIFLFFKQFKNSVRSNQFLHN